MLAQSHAARRTRLLLLGEGAFELVVGRRHSVDAIERDEHWFASLGARQRGQDGTAMEGQQGIWTLR